MQNWSDGRAAAFMARPGADEDREAAPARPSGFYESLPLLIGATALFLAGLVTWWSGIRAGPTAFPLWAVFVVAGFVVSIGAVLSWFFAEGSIYESTPPAPPSRAPARSSATRTDFGRPRPDVGTPLPRPASARAVPLAPWDEGPVPEEPSTPPPKPRPSGRPAENADTILDELEEISRALHPRRGQGQDASD